MKSSLTICFLVAFCLALGACSDKKETTSLPTPPPELPPEQPIELPPLDPINTDDRIPNLERTVPFKTISESALADIAGNFFPELVGEPLIAMDLIADRDDGLQGDLFFSFEDQAGFFGVAQRSFEYTGFTDNRYLDIIFQDSELVTRVTGTITNDVLTGTVHYRKTAPGDAYLVTPSGQQYRPCTPVNFQCSPDINWECAQYHPYISGMCIQWRQVPDYSRCEAAEQALKSQQQTSCLEYMSPSRSEVKELGTFEAAYSNWF